MASLAVVQAVEARLKAGFDRCPVFVENKNSSTPTDGTTWLLVDFPFARSRQATIGAPGANRYHEEGAFRVVLNVKAGRATHEYRGWLEEIAALFRGQAFDGVRTYAPQPPTSDDRSDVGAYFRLQMMVPYDASLFG